MVEPAVDRVLVPVYPDAAKALSLGRTKTNELVASGQLRSVTIGRRRLVPRSAIIEFVARLEEQASSPAPQEVA